MSLAASVISIFRRVTVVIAIAIAFLFGVGTTVYLSLRSPEVKVPDVIGKDRFDAEKILADADLNFRVRASRPSNQVKPDVVLFQLPRAGEVVKAGQTVAMDISRATKEGETPETVKPAEEPSENRNTNAGTNANENKPKRPRPVNKNGNDNSNGNGNQNSNSNRPSNVNRINSNSPAGNVNAPPRGNINRSDVHNSNSRVNSNQNDTRRPSTTRPSTSVPTPARTPGRF